MQIESRNNNAVAAFVAEIKEAAMQEFMWDQPVKLSMPGDGDRCINGPREALHCLAEWTDAGGWFYERAKNRCHAALEMNGDLALSRQAFIAAAIDASLQWD
ncbi:DUF982 domain-containing protein [Sinorhizobium meliloti]|uniref:DUF982 domain-containing protein n=1 Tax=Rhizobium meliloti TaxID=382 RepID=UPI0020908621|nr:DUF982 domain-containing protein [Sinorhizobium meliloti]MCO5963673.1 DUF982 domain-containing protein [Sinorhizobium meliloti]